MTLHDTRASRAALRFVIAGGLLSLLNLAMRSAFESALDFEIAVAIAGALTLVLSFFAYRRWVFRDHAAINLRAVAIFLAVNLVGLAVTVAVAAAALIAARAWPGAAFTETLAHGIGIVAGAAATFPLYRPTTLATQR